MTILFATDFSPSATRALHVAARLASRMKTTLHIAHALEWPPGIEIEDRPSLLAATRKVVEAQEALASEWTPAVVSSVEIGRPADALIALTHRAPFDLLVVGSVGTRVKGKGLGHVADRLAQQTRVPTLVVRDEAPFVEWIEGKRPLKVVVGVDTGEASEAAWKWARALSGAGPVELIGLSVYWPLGEFQRLGMMGVRSAIDASPEIEAVLRRDFEHRLAPGKSHVHLVPWVGRPSDQLCGLADDQHADVLVVGSHRRSAFERLWESSVSRGVVHEAACSVALVPSDAGTRAPTFETVLVATDLSETGNQAIAHAVACAAPGARLFVLHVIEPDSTPPPLAPWDVFAVDMAGDHPLRKKLLALVPPSAAERGLRVETVLAASFATAEAIAQAAERLGADVICVGTRGHGPLKRAVLGSVAHAVLSMSPRPLLLSKGTAS